MPIEVHIVTPEREVWSGETPLLIARGVDGEVGIQAGHMPILVQLAVGVLKVTQEPADIRAVIDGGFLHVATENGVTRADVLASGAELADEIDGVAARRRLEELQASEDTADVEVKLAIAKAAARVALAG